LPPVDLGPRVHGICHIAIVEARGYSQRGRPVLNVLLTLTTWPSSAYCRASIERPLLAPAYSRTRPKAEVDRNVSVRLKQSLKSVEFPATRAAVEMSQVGCTQVPYIAPRVLCITVPQSLLLRADEVIE
jgi:hypothetical protein